MSERNAAALYHMPIKLILLNNSELGKISKEQRACKFSVWQTKLTNPNFAEFTTNCEALGIRVESVSDLLSAMEEVFDHDGPAVVDIHTDVSLI